MTRTILPIINNNEFVEGQLVKAIPRCKTKYCKEACEKFYQRIHNLEDGFYQCPTGYTVLKNTYEESVLIYSGLRVKGFYDKKKVEKFEKTSDYCVLTPDFCLKLVELDIQVKNIENELERQKEIHKDLLHDIRKLDSIVKNKAEEIISFHNRETDEETRIIIQKVRNIQAMEELISCKYSVYDLVSNIDLLGMGNKSWVSVYKKFDKVRYILLNYKNKGIQIDFHGETDFKYNVNAVYFDMVPFLLLENAVKYSHGKHKVEVYFVENNSKLQVSVESFGPYCPKDELPLLFNKNYRGSIAKGVTTEGTGIGLYLVKQICEQHGIEIKIESEYKKRANGVVLGTFKVSLFF